MGGRVSILVFTAIACGHAQDSVQLQFAAKAGDTVRLRMARIREDANRPERNGRSHTPVDIRVLEAAGDGYVVNWKYGATSMDRQLTAAEKSVMEASSKLIESLQLEVMLDRHGAFQKLRNEVSVSRGMAGMVAGVMDFLRKAEPDEAKWKQIEPAMRQALSPQNQLMMITRDVQSYFGWYGVRFAKGETTETAAALPFPLGSGTVPVIIRARLVDQADPKKAMFASTTEYDGNALRDLTLKFFAQVMPQATLEQRQQMPALNASDEGRYVYNRASGWMDEILVTRRMSLADKVRRSDGWEFRRE